MSYFVEGEQELPETLIVKGSTITVLDKKARFGVDQETGWQFIESQNIKVFSDEPMIIRVGKHKYIKITA